MACDYFWIWILILCFHLYKAPYFILLFFLNATFYSQTRSLFHTYTAESPVLLAGRGGGGVQLRHGAAHLPRHPQHGPLPPGGPAL